MTPDLFTRAESAAAFVLSQTALRPQIGLVLGSGLGAFADDLTEAVRIAYADIPTFPRSTAIRHVHCSGSNCGTAYGDERPGHLMRDEYGRRNSRSSDRPQRSTRSGTTSDGTVHRAATGSTAADCRGAADGIDSPRGWRRGKPRLYGKV